jgi:hypothetical protein
LVNVDKPFGWQTSKLTGKLALFCFSLFMVMVRCEKNHQHDSPKGMKVTAGMPGTSGPPATTGMTAIAGMPAIAGTPTTARMLTKAGTPGMVET